MIEHIVKACVQRYAANAELARIGRKVVREVELRNANYPRPCVTVSLAMTETLDTFNDDVLVWDIAMRLLGKSLRPNDADIWLLEMERSFEDALLEPLPKGPYDCIGTKMLTKAGPSVVEAGDSWDAEFVFRLYAGRTELVPDPRHASGGGTADLIASQDTWRSFQPGFTTPETDGAPDGLDIKNIVGVDLTKYFRTWLHFNLVSIPTDSVITSALLKMSVKATNATGAECTIHRLTQPDWLEEQLTWYDYNTGASLSWVTPGGDYTATGAITYNMAVATGTDAQVVDITTLVQDAIDNRAKQLHLLIKKTVETVGSFSGIDYWSLNPDFPYQKPHLVLAYDTA
jgi:hypothetical protein